MPLKAVQKVGDKTLVDRTIRLLSDVPEIDHTILYGSCESITKYITVPEHQNIYRFVKRPIWMDGDGVTFNDILNKAIDYLETDYVVFMTYTSPFIKPETISHMIQKIKKEKYDSAFTITEHKIFAWYQGYPINYNLNTPIPRTQDLEPIWLEASSLYIFNLNYYMENNRRIGRNPYIMRLGKIEGWDIDTMEDLQIAQSIAKTRAGGDWG